MKYLKLFNLFLISLLFIYCSTPYQPKGMLGGYTEVNILGNLYRVEFEGNQHSKPNKIQNYLMYRCAELTQEKGYNYFVIVSEERHFDEYSVRPEVVAPGKNRGSMSGGTRVVANPDFQNPTSSTKYTAAYVIKLLDSV
ncbi:MAG: hypothetical protein V3W20_06395, partial [Candidatus Neomarinimicrobiota bacterium]